MPDDKHPDDRPTNRDVDRQTTFLHESDFPSESGADQEKETFPKRLVEPDKSTFESDALVGATVTLNVDDDHVLGNFRLISKLGSGGFGTVYKAEDLRLERFVAMKAALSRPADRGDEQFKRVLHEGRAAAALDHPNIVSIYEVAELGGKPYIISQLIDGVTLKQWKAFGEVTARKLAEVMILVARAVDYANGKGVVHRDLKPGNILMDADGVPYVNDFGIAKHSDAEETLSNESSIIGTPAYMSPEQASGHSGDADQRSDLYSLGVILYELTTGEKPFRGHARMLIHHVIHTEPQSPRMLDQSVPHDLETICLKCLEKDPDRRYQTCAELADELERFVDGEPILARPISTLEHFVRRCRRHRLTTAITGGLIVAIACGLIGVTWQWRRAERSRQQAVTARVEIEQSRQKLADRVAYSDQMLHDAESKLAFSSMMAGDHRHAKQSLKQLSKLGDVEHRLLKTIEDRYTERFRHVEAVRDIAISDDQQFIAAAGLRTLLVWDTSTGQVVHRFRQKGLQLRCVDFQPGGHELAWGGQSGRIHLRAIGPANTSTRKLVHGAPINSIKFSHDGTRILAAGERGKVSVWSVETEEPFGVHRVSSSSIAAADFIDNETLISGDADGAVTKCVIQTGDIESVFSGQSSVLSIDVKDHSNEFVVGMRNSHLATGPINDPDAIETIYTTSGPVVDVEFWESKNAIVTTNLFGRLSVWKLPRKSVYESHRYFQGIGHFAIARASNQLLIGSGDGAIVSIDVDDVQPHVIRTEKGGVADFVFFDSTLVVCHEGGPASVIQVETGRLLRTLPDDEKSDAEEDSSENGLRRQRMPKSMTCVDRCDDASKLAFGTADGRILVWNTKNGKSRIHGRPTDKLITQIQVSDDAMWALTGGIDGGVRLWDLAKEDTSVGLAALGGVVRGLTLADDGRHAVAVSAGGVAVLVDAVERKLIRRIEAKQPLQCVAWSPDATQIAIGGNRGSILLYPRDLSGNPKRIEAHNGIVGGVLFAPSGNRIITVGNDGHLTFSNLVTQRSGATLEGIHGSSIRSLAIDQNGRWLATGDVGGVVRIWSLSGE